MLLVVSYSLSMLSGFVTVPSLASLISVVSAAVSMTVG